MNAAIEWANGLAGHWARGMWPVLWQTAALAAVVGLVALCNRRMSPALRFWLWMLVPLRLLVMPLIVISLPVLARPPAAHLEPAVAPSSFTSQAPAEAPALDLTVQPETPPIVVQRQVRASIWAWLMAGWLAGIGFFALRLARGWLRMKAIANQARENSDPRVRDCARDAAAMLGLRKIPRIMSAAEGISPFVLGHFRAVVVLPATLADHVSPDELRSVLAHEFAHVRRRDALLGWVLACSDVIYFFNPVVHLVKRAIIFERERACDEQVLALAQAPRAVYARALLTATGLTRPAATRLSCAPVLLESGQHLERRLKSIGDERRPSATLSRTARLVLLAIALLALPGVTLTARSAAAPELTRETLLNIMKKERDSISTYHFKYSVRTDVKFQQKPFDDMKKYVEYEIIRSDGKAWITTGFERGAPPMCFTTWNGEALKTWCPIAKKGKIDKGDDSLGWALAASDTSPLDSAMLRRIPTATQGIFPDLASMLESPRTIVATEEHGGIKAVVVRAGPYTIWLDPARGYAVIDIICEATSGTKKTPWFGTENMGFQDCGNGLWLPTETIRKQYSPPNNPEHPAGTLWYVQTVRVEVLEINKEYPDSLFDLQFPEGTKVDDQVAHMTYESGLEKTDAGMIKDSAVCQLNLGLIVKGIQSYRSLNNWAMPPSLADLFPKYLGDPKVLICPADKSPMKIRNGFPCSYRYIGNVPRLGSSFIAYDHAQHDGGRNVAYWDGDVHHVSEQDFKEGLAKMYEQLKPLMTKPDFPGDRTRVKAFCEDKDFPEEAVPAGTAPLASDAASPLDLKIKAVSLPGVSLREALEILQTQVGRDRNFVVDPHVDTGRITLDLKNVTLGQTLTAMLKGSDLTFMFVPSDNLIYISTKDGCAAYEQYPEPSVPQGQPGLRQMLDKTIKEVSLPGVSLPEAVEILKADWKGVKITIDPEALKEAQGTQIFVDLHDVPLRVALKSMLLPLHVALKNMLPPRGDLYCEFVDGGINITVFSMRQYDVGDIVSSMGGKALLEELTERTGRENWDAVQTANLVPPILRSSFDHQPSRLMVLRGIWLMVNNTEAVHKKIEGVLRELREAPSGSLEPKGAATAATP